MLVGDLTKLVPYLASELNYTEYAAELDFITYRDLDGYEVDVTSTRLQSQRAMLGKLYLAQPRDASDNSSGMIEIQILFGLLRQVQSPAARNASTSSVGKLHE
jgi:hypothetical protein